VLKEGSDVVVSVKDDGSGIAQDKLTEVFELFAQVDRTLENARGGLGIGLSLVKQLVEMHGGDIVAKSAGIGHGSEFVVRLPAIAAPAQTRSARRRATDGVSRRILVVDDNHDAARSLSVLLELSGHVTKLAHDGQEAVQKAADFSPEVILLDIGLPKLSGYDVCKTIRRGTANGQPMIIALTGWGQDDDRARTREAGFDAHLVKPVDIGMLKKLLGRSRSEAIA
jgi:CheY-like chemotaxis protein